MQKNVPYHGMSAYPPSMFQCCGSASIFVRIHIRIQILLVIFDVDPDPDPTFHFVAVPDPTFHFDADPDLDPDPSLKIKAQNLERAQIGSYFIHLDLSSTT
jgi:hypothetical protein